MNVSTVLRKHEDRFSSSCKLHIEQNMDNEATLALPHWIPKYLNMVLSSTSPQELLGQAQVRQLNSPSSSHPPCASITKLCTQKADMEAWCNCKIPLYRMNSSLVISTKHQVNLTKKFPSGLSNLVWEV